MMRFLRSFEQIAGCQAIRPDIAGIMGAFGAALIAKERYEGHGNFYPSIGTVRIFVSVHTSMTRCKGCTNALSVNDQ